MQSIMCSVQGMLRAEHEVVCVGHGRVKKKICSAAEEIPLRSFLEDVTFPPLYNILYEVCCIYNFHYINCWWFEQE